MYAAKIAPIHIIEYRTFDKAMISTERMINARRSTKPIQFGIDTELPSIKV